MRRGGDERVQETVVYGNASCQIGEGYATIESANWDLRPRRLLIVSHPAVVDVNQAVYLELARRGLDVTIVVPARWRHPYAHRDFGPTALPGLEGRLRPLRVALPGRPQRHFYLARPGKVLAGTKPDAVFLEAEPYSLVAAQWGMTLQADNVPFGVQMAENIDRRLPAPIRITRRAILHRARFVAARSDTAAQLARALGARGHVALAPHAVPAWTVESAPEAGRPFTVGYAGRLVPEKGIDQLVDAVRRLDAPVELLLAGDGELRSRLEGAPIPGSQVQVVEGVPHDRMPEVYGRMDVLVLPSRTTPTWKEQFGRVIVEALWCGVPVVGSDSGEIPWLIERTGGGLIFPEGNVDVLSKRLEQLRADRGLRAQLAARGRAAVESSFSVPAATDALGALLEAVW